MQQTSVERITIVHEIVCDRCGARARRGGVGNDFRHMTSIGFTAQEGSVFGQGQRVEIDLCEPCLRSALGEWLRVTDSAEGDVGADLAAKPASVEPKRQGGEFPAGDAQGLDSVFRSVAVADAEDAVAEMPALAPASAFADSWVPVAELFNRLADGDALEKILKAPPQISRHGAAQALREAALRFPPYACFHPAADVWTPRYPHER